MNKPQKIVEKTIVQVRLCQGKMRMWKWGSLLRQIPKFKKIRFLFQLQVKQWIKLKVSSFQPKKLQYPLKKNWFCPTAVIHFRLTSAYHLKNSDSSGLWTGLRQAQDIMKNVTKNNSCIFRKMLHFIVEIEQFSTLFWHWNSLKTNSRCVQRFTHLKTNGYHRSPVEEWRIAKELCEIVYHFEEARTCVSWENFNRASLVIMLNWGLLEVGAKLMKKTLKMIFQWKSLRVVKGDYSTDLKIMSSILLWPCALF